MQEYTFIQSSSAQIQNIRPHRNKGFMHLSLCKIGVIFYYAIALFAGYDSVCYYEVTLENIDNRAMCNQQVKYSMRVNKVYYM